MRCPKCNDELPKLATVCPRCGHGVVVDAANPAGTWEYREVEIDLRPYNLTRTLIGPRSPGEYFLSKFIPVLLHAMEPWVRDGWKYAETEFDFGRLEWEQHGLNWQFLSCRLPLKRLRRSE